MAFLFDRERKRLQSELEGLIEEDRKAEDKGDAVLMRSVLEQQIKTKQLLAAATEIYQGIVDAYKSRGLIPPSQDDPEVIEILKEMAEEKTSQVSESAKPTDLQVEKKNWRIDEKRGIFIFDGRIIKVNPTSNIWKLICLLAKNPNKFVPAKVIAEINNNSRTVAPMVADLRNIFGLPVVTGSKYGEGYALILGEQLQDHTETTKEKISTYPKATIESTPKIIIVTIGEKTEKLEGKTAKLAVVLLKNHEKIVTTDELIEEVGATKKSSIHQLVREIRRRFENNPNDPKIFVRDISGYQALIKELEEKVSSGPKRIELTNAKETKARIQLREDKVETDTTTPIGFGHQEIIRLCARAMECEEFLLSRGLDVLTQCQNRFNSAANSERTFKRNGEDLKQTDKNLRDNLLRVARNPERLKEQTTGRTLVLEILGPIIGKSPAEQEEYLNHLIYYKKSMVYGHELTDAPGALRRIK